MDWRQFSFREYYEAHCDSDTGFPGYSIQDLYYMFKCNAVHYGLKDTVACAVNRLCMMGLDASPYNVMKQTDHLRPDICSPARWRAILNLVKREGMPQSM